ncbi:MAG: J domain-containing protein, partial [Phycisphaeraceae bacterium]
LGDPEKRKKYDQLGANWKHGQDFAAGGGRGFGNGGFSSSYGGGQGGEFSGDFSDFFNQFFGGGHDRTAGHRRGRATSFEDLFGGSAGGMGGGGMGGGGMGGMGAGPSGAGRAGAAQTPMQETEATVSLYEAHHGTTRQLSLQGPQGTQTLDVKIPAGVTDGSKIRLRDKGVQIKVRVAGDPRFQVSGHDLTTDVRVDPATAALGGKTDVETLEGPATLTIPPGTSSGGKLRLKGKGLHKRGQDERGDLFARVMITVPKSLTDEQREAFEKLREAS